MRIEVFEGSWHVRGLAPRAGPPSAPPQSGISGYEQHLSPNCLLKRFKPPRKEANAPVMMRTQRLVLLERLQPLHDFLLHGRAGTLQQVYESGLTWQPNLSVLKSNRSHLSGGTRASGCKSVALSPPQWCFLIGIPRISSKAGKAGSSWRFGSGWQLSDLTPSCSPKTPPCRRHLFVT